MRVPRWACWLAAALFLSGCSNDDIARARRDRAERTAADAGFAATQIPTGVFTLQSFLKVAPSSSDGPLVVYIEGDGQAWIDRTTVAADPSPDEALALDLAVRDDGPAVAYLGRPCQFATRLVDAACAPRYWTSHRFAPEVVAAMDAAVSRLKARSGRQALALIGYSGGGVIATLLAARRPDVVRLVTVAAPLDLAYWTAHHGVSPLDGSLDPARGAPPGPRVVQSHLVGEDDRVVPPDTLLSYIKAIGGGSVRTVTRIPGFAHKCCWVENWPGLLRRLRAER